MSTSFPTYLGAGSDEPQMRAAVVHGDAWPESRAFIVKVLSAQCERPDLVPLDWPERTTTPISASGVSWLLPDVNGDVHQSARPEPADICDARGITASAGESVQDAIREMRALLGFGGSLERELAEVREAEERAARLEAELLLHRRERRRRVHGGGR